MSTSYLPQVEHVRDAIGAAIVAVMFLGLLALYFFSKRSGRKQP